MTGHDSSVNIPEILSRVMLSDLYRLRTQWLRMIENATGKPDEAAVRRWLESAQHSAQLYTKRDQSIPNNEYDEQLPICAHRDQIIELLRQHQTIVICGETGSGKSTQLPKICLDAGLGRSGIIGHTQPRRLAARAVASRLAEELGTQVGGLVGFKIRFTDTTSASTLIKVMTDGVLLAETQSDRFLEQYDALIIDEAHERSLNIDFLLGYLKRILGKRQELKLIITSATIDPQRFADHFCDRHGPAPILEVSGRTYPVELRYRPIGVAGENDDQEDFVRLQGISSAVSELISEGPGDVLIFLPTERDIRLASKHLRGELTQRGIADHVEILPLYARLSQAEQNRIFATHPIRRLILATNVAESSLTVPGIRYVIDTGLVRLSRYASRSKVQRLPIEPVSQASANQRSGRCGRVGPGICIRLYDESDFLSRPRFTTPEIRRSDLANVLLQSQVLRLGPLDEFPLMDIPPAEAIRDAERTLRELGAIDGDKSLTSIGKQLGRLPCDVRVGRMLLEAHQRGCLAEVVIIAAGLEIPDVRQRPAGNAAQADSAHQPMQDPHSDFLSLIRVWDFYENLRSQFGRSRLQKALQQNFLSHHGLREWTDTMRQLRDLLEAAGLQVGGRKLKLAAVPTRISAASEKAGDGKAAAKNSRDDESEQSEMPRPEGYAAIHQSLLSGLLSGIAHRDQQKEYKACGGISIKLWPGSGLFRRAPKWVMAAEIVETSQRYGRTVAELDVEWIEHAGRELLKHSYSQPHWSEKTGAAMVYRKSTLYGLTIVAARRVPLGTIDPASARAMMIEQGLVGGQWRCDLPFYKHNRELIADMEELVQRTRSRKYIIDRYHLMNFYERRVPENVYDLHGLRNWLSTSKDTSSSTALCMRPEDLLAEDDKGMDIAHNFPNAIQIGPTEFPLRYHFEPGHERDGVTITIPQIALRQVSDEALGWLVPGLLEEKILAIIKSLPKSIRTSFVPGPDVARQLAEQLQFTDRQIPFSVALAEKMSVKSGETISPPMLRSITLPNHYSFLLEVVNDDGQVVATGRDLKELASRFGISEQISVDSGLKSDVAWVDQVIRNPEQLDLIPKEITVLRAGVRVTAYGAVVDSQQTAIAKLVNTQEEAQRLSKAGMTRLYALKNSRLLKNQVKHLPDLNRSLISLGNILPAAQWQQGLQDLIARVAFVEGQQVTISSIEFESRQHNAASRISVATQEVAEWLPKLSSQYMVLRLALEKAPQMWSAVTNDLRSQLNELFCVDFLVTTPWQWLREFPRYLQAAHQRLEKLSSGGIPRDRKLAEPVENFCQQLKALEQSPRSHELSVNERLVELRWAIEEFRVSIFAQKLGTKMTVSPKRLGEMIDQIMTL
jgi:ATP-dependent helicase HrpA